jgi:1,4-dihydroxy-2-naphthoyl-CoA hydrolase
MLAADEILGVRYALAFNGDHDLAGKCPSDVVVRGSHRKRRRGGGMETEQLHESMPLCQALGMRVCAVSAERVELQLDWSPTLCTTAGVLHGGALMALADAAGGVCAFVNLPAGAGTSTIESKTNFIRAVRDGTVTATATPLHVGGTTIVVETEVRRSDGKLVAKVTQSQAVLRR